MMPYNDFRREYIAQRKGQRFDTRAFGAAWRAYKEANTNEKPRGDKRATSSMGPVVLDGGEGNSEPDGGTIDTPAPAVPVVRGDPITIDPQPEGSILQSQPVDGATVPEIVPPTTTPPPARDTESYKLIADVVHNALAEIVKFATDDAVEIEKKQIDRLNEAGAQLIAKYDTSGIVAQYGPEIAYFGTMADIGVQIYLHLQEKKDAPAKETVTTTATDPRNDLDLPKVRG